VTDFGLHELRDSADRVLSEAEGSLCGEASHEGRTEEYKLLWVAPELLRREKPFPSGTPRGDVYSFGIILYEIYGRGGPYGPAVVDYAGVVSKVRSPEGVELMRPDLEALEDTDLDYKCPTYVLGKQPQQRFDESDREIFLPQML
jgi:serine/threonine protein kinase